MKCNPVQVFSIFGVLPKCQFELRNAFQGRDLLPVFYNFENILKSDHDADN